MSSLSVSEVFCPVINRASPAGRAHEPVARPRDPVSAPEAFLRDVVCAAARHMGKTPAQILGTKRTRDCADPRQICWIVARLAPERPLSLPKIGKAFGRDHSTVSQGFKHQCRLAMQPAQAWRMNAIEAIAGELVARGWAVSDGIEERIAFVARHNRIEGQAWFPARDAVAHQLAVASTPMTSAELVEIVGADRKNVTNALRLLELRRFAVRTGKRGYFHLWAVRIGAGPSL